MQAHQENRSNIKGKGVLRSPPPPPDTKRETAITKRLKIIRCKPSDIAQPSGFVESDWHLLRRFIRSILNGSESDVGYIKATRICENICTYGNERYLFENLNTELQSFTVGLSEYLNNMKVNSDTFLEKLNSSWKTYQSHLKLLSAIFCQLDRGYILQETKHGSLVSMGSIIFREKILSSPMFRTRVFTALIELIEKSRAINLTTYEITLLQEQIQMLVYLSYYSSDFEPLLLENTKYYYKAKAKELMTQFTPSGYIRFAQQCINGESSVQGSGYFPLDTEEQIVEIITRQLIVVNAQQIIDEGFDEMMNEDTTNTLGQLYNMLRLYPEIVFLREAFERYIKRQGVNMIKSPDNDSTMIETLLKFKTKIDKILNVCFQTDEVFSNMLKESFEYFINTRGNKPAEMVSKFIDEKIKSSNQNEDTMKLIDDALGILRFVYAKDVFQVHYKRLLAERLLSSSGFSINAEDKVIQNLRVEYGKEYTKSLKSMVNDIKDSSDWTSKFSKLNKKTASFFMTIKVISKNEWPSFPDMKLILPTEMALVLRNFTEIYLRMFKGRHLICQKSMSSCIVEANFPKGVKTITTTLAHCAVLLLFNIKPVISLVEIKYMTGMEQEHLVAIMKTLSTGSMNILKLKTTEDSPIFDRQYEYNADFESENSDLKIMFKPTTQVDSDDQIVEVKVTKDRLLQVEAAIVRIMKNQKTMRHDELMAAVKSEIKYPIDDASIKSQITSLIDKAYIERSQQKQNVYHYLS